MRIAIVPLAVKQIHSMQNLQRFAPQMKEIQQKYKHDKQKQNEELMRFYKEHKINPAASCLPLLAQLPVFFALYLRFTTHVSARRPARSSAKVRRTTSTGSAWSTSRSTRPSAGARC